MILVYDYKISYNDITYFYWNENGENSKSIAFKSKGDKGLQVIDNQIYCDKKQLTFDKSNKLKPILIDNKTILFLSDYDRGIGLFIFRKIKLE